MLDILELSRLQFALTALYHFLFVPLTIGLSALLVVMEAAYLFTGRTVYKDMVKFWGKLFGINFALGVTTGITMEFQFGTNWSYYSHYVGDIFGAPLAIEGAVAFFAESTFVGLFFFGWDRLSKVQHFISTILVAVGSCFSALWILVANGWMQFPTAAEFNPVTMRMELASFTDLVFSPIAQTKFLHVVGAAYTTGAVFVASVSAYYILRKTDLAFAFRSFVLASVFGLFASISVVLMGDEAGYELVEIQPSKIAAIEGLYDTEPAPLGWKVFAHLDSDKQEVTHDLTLPYLGSIILTRSLSETIPGLKEIVSGNELKILNGVEGLLALKELRSNPKVTHEQKVAFSKQYSKDLGFGILYQAHYPELEVTAERIKEVAALTVPKAGPLFYTFRIMMFAGFAMLLLFTLNFVQVLRRKIGVGKYGKAVLVGMLLILPLPWFAVETGWFVAEYGRQPWAIFEMLPVDVAHSNLSSHDLIFSIALITGIYSLFIFFEMFFMLKWSRTGPSLLQTGKYYFERAAVNEQPNKE